LRNGPADDRACVIDREDMVATLKFLLCAAYWFALYQCELLTRAFHSQRRRGTLYRSGADATPAVLPS
jgi:hypothetical protein